MIVIDYPQSVRNNTETQAYDWEFLFSVDRCHRWFRDRISGWIAVADYSGNEPHQTDDGVLWLMIDREIVFQQGHPIIPLMSETGLETTLGGTTSAEAEKLIEEGLLRRFY